MLSLPRFPGVTLSPVACAQMYDFVSPLGSALEVLYRGSLGPLHAWVGGEGLTGHLKAVFAKQAHCSFLNYYLFIFGCASSSLLGSVSRATLQLRWASFSLR